MSHRNDGSIFDDLSCRRIYSLFILGYEFWKLYVRKDSLAKGWKYPILTIVLSGCFLIGAAYGCKWLNWYTYNNDEAYGFLPHITVLAQMLWMRVIMDMKHMRRIGRA